MTSEDHRRICVLAGPSGVGKGTVVAQLLAQEPRIWLSISATTRAPRPGEREGESYFFVDDEHFDHLVESGEMLEWAIVHGKHRYGTPRQPVLDAYAAGKIPLLEIDLAGARQVRQSLPEAFQIFLAPPSFQELEARLRGRGTETEEAIERRLETARGELAAQGEFDAVVVNDTVARATGEILDLIAPKR